LHIKNFIYHLGLLGKTLLETKKKRVLLTPMHCCIRLFAVVCLALFLEPKARGAQGLSIPAPIQAEVEVVVEEGVAPV